MILSYFRRFVNPIDREARYRRGKRIYSEKGGVRMGRGEVGGKGGRRKGVPLDNEHIVTRVSNK